MWLPYTTGRSLLVQRSGNTTWALPTCGLPLSRLPRLLLPLLLLLLLLLLIPSAPALLLRVTLLLLAPGADLVRKQPLYGVPEPLAYPCVGERMYRGARVVFVAGHAAGPGVE